MGRPADIKRRKVVQSTSKSSTAPKAKLVKKQPASEEEESSVEESDSEQETTKSNKRVKITEKKQVDSDSDSESESDEESVEIKEGLEDLSGEEDEDEEEELELGEDEFESESDEEITKEEKDKANFAKSFTAILGSSIKKHDKANPILIRSKKSARDIEQSKLESKAKRLLNMEKKKIEDKCRVKAEDILALYKASEDDNKVEANGSQLTEMLAHEKKMKKIAQRGVIRLFNAILSSQITTDQIEKTSVNPTNGNKIVGATKREELMNEMSKEKFLDLIKSGGKIAN
ncbi:Rrp15p-domain-containing protein [Nadsonia fulvescens var. elongata DSM 6958]|uniref:Rrp15p-domain-containing protein n=1 Tax=Nadsonia fulvescens var. elongata DSM 6958 TaxID=857566 RepID=A0A1E3PCU5_9ASCO|nr:Rrp15p-domain-containing protein [Nadsonia fulvescens var. elongata DSM 6958]